MRSFSAYIVLSLVLLTGFACQQGHDREGVILNSFREEIEEIFLAHSRQTIIYAVGFKDSALVSSVAKKLAEVYQKRELPDSVAYYEQFAARFVPRSDEVTKNVYPEEIKEEYIISERELVDFYIACKDSGQVASVALSLAEQYRRREQLDSAIYYDQYALRFTQGTEEKLDLLLYRRQYLDFEAILPGSAGIVTSAKALAEIYWELGRQDSAIYYYQYALAFAKDADEKVISDRLADLCHERALQQEQASRQRLLGILLRISTAVLVLGVLAFLFLRLKGRRGEAKIKRCPIEERKQGCLIQESLPEITEDRVVVSSTGKNEQAELFLNSEICLRFRDKNPWRPTANDWAELYRNLDLAYDNFTVRLRNLIPITDKELQTACLIKAGVMPGVIGQLLCCSPASVSMTRKRLYEKIYQKPGSAELFDQFISQF